MKERNKVREAKSWWGKTENVGEKKERQTELRMPSLFSGIMKKATVHDRA